MSERFHVNCDLAPGVVSLTGPEAHHLATVCRLRPGDAVCLFNGDGRQYPARVVEVARRDVTVEVVAVESPDRELPFELHIAAPLPKGDRAQFLVEKLTEVGVTALWLIATQRTVVQPREAKLDKLQRHVIEASKQCGRNVLMRIEPPRDWRGFVSDATLPRCRLLAHPLGRSGEPSGAAAGPASRAGPTGVVAAVGPEGGFTEPEVAEATAAGWQLLDLGPRILRVETAALVLATRLAK